MSDTEPVVDPDPNQHNPHAWPGTASEPVDEHGNPTSPGATQPELDAELIEGQDDDDDDQGDSPENASS